MQVNRVVHLAPYYLPHRGGVETHLKHLNEELVKRGYKVTVICQSHDSQLVASENIGAVEVIRIPVHKFYPQTSLSAFLSKFYYKIKFWTWITKHSSVLTQADRIQVHDVFWWVWPIYPLIFYKTYITFHGWEGKYPLRLRDKLQRFYNSWVAKGSLHIGTYIQKFYFDKPDQVVFGGVKVVSKKNKSDNFKKSEKFLDNVKTIIFLGRLEQVNEIGLYLELYKKLKESLPKIKIIFIGDGEFRQECEKHGEVTGYIENTRKYLKQADLVFASSYLSVFEAQSLHKIVVSFHSNPVKKETLVSFPSNKAMIIGKDVERVKNKLEALKTTDAQKMMNLGYKTAQQHSWDKVANIYEKLWNLKGK